MFKSLFFPIGLVHYEKMDATQQLTCQLAPTFFHLSLVLGKTTIIKTFSHPTYILHSISIPDRKSTVINNKINLKNNNNSNFDYKENIGRIRILSNML